MSGKHPLLSSEKSNNDDCTPFNSAIRLPSRPFFLASLNGANTIEPSTPMIAITTSNSINVNPLLFNCNILSFINAFIKVLFIPLLYCIIIIFL